MVLGITLKLPCDMAEYPNGTGNRLKICRQLTLLASSNLVSATICGYSMCTSAIFGE